MSVAMPISRPRIVSNLTDYPVRHRRVVIHRSLLVLLVFVGTTMPFNPVVGQTGLPRWQPVEQITETAETFLRARTGVFDGTTKVHARQLDARHRLPFCSEPLAAFMRSGAEISVRNIVGVRCSGMKPWKVYVPVDVVVVADVLVARQTLVKGQLISAKDLTLERRDVSRLRNGYLSEAQQVIGQRLKTQLIAGQTLKPSMLAADMAIRRGQSVTLVVESGDFSIRMSGTALMDGALQQRIRVRNDNSGRIVEGIVRSGEHVEIFHATPKVSPPLADTGLSNNDR